MFFFVLFCLFVLKELNGDREESEGIGEEAIARYHANGEYEDGHHDDDSVEYASSDEYDFQREGRPFHSIAHGC